VSLKDTIGPIHHYAPGLQNSSHQNSSYRDSSQRDGSHQNSSHHASNLHASCAGLPEPQEAPWT
jgi:hypothetical protein